MAHRDCASAGGIQAIGNVLGALPRDLPAAVVIIQHRLSTRQSRLARILAAKTRMPVVTAADQQSIVPGTVYVARPDFHLTVAADRTFAYMNGRRICFVSSSANPLLESAAAVLGAHVVAVVLTGSGSDGTDGVQSVKAHGGIVIAQDPFSSAFVGMPRAAIESGAVDRVLPLEDIGPALVEIVSAQTVVNGVG